MTLKFGEVEIFICNSLSVRVGDGGNKIFITAAAPPVAVISVDAMKLTGDVFYSSPTPRVLPLY